LLVDCLREYPDGPTRIEPARLATYLTTPETAYRSVATDWGQRLAQARALARGLGAALRCDFQRELTTVLGEAWTARAGTAARRAEPLDQALALAPEARRIAWQRLRGAIRDDLEQLPGYAEGDARRLRLHHEVTRWLLAGGVEPLTAAEIEELGLTPWDETEEA
jgi:hypothetical protein